jgi:hypothetical protein
VVTVDDMMNFDLDRFIKNGITNICRSQYRVAEEELSSKACDSFITALSSNSIRFDRQDIIEIPSQLFENVATYIYKRGPSEECWQMFGGKSTIGTEILTLASIASKHYDNLCNDILSTYKNEISNLKVYENLSPSSGQRVRSYVEFCKPKIEPLGEFRVATKWVSDSVQLLVEMVKKY